LKEISEKFIEKVIDMVNQIVHDTLKKFQDTKNKEHRKTKKQMNELRQDFNKHQNETKDTIKREIHELKMITQNIKEELNKDMENFRKKNQTEILEIKSSLSQIKNKEERLSSRPEQMEGRISEPKDKIGIKEKQKTS
jgi:hypothetical protein